MPMIVSCEPSANDTDVKVVMSWKAYNPIFVTDAGIVTDVIFVLAKA